MIQLPSIIVRCQLRPLSSVLVPCSHSKSPTPIQLRKLSADNHDLRGAPASPSVGFLRPSKSPPVPHPTPFVPDTQTFLKLIGRNLSQYADKIPKWKDLFTLDSKALKDLGVAPPNSRRYLKWWIERYRRGDHGVGGDLQFIKDGVAELQIVQVPRAGAADATSTLSPGMRKIVVNVPVGGSVEDLPLEKLKPVKFVRIKGGNTITGTHVLPMRGKGRAKIEVKQGLWEVGRGRKIDGGERRQAMIRAKRRGEEKRAASGLAR